MLQAKDIIEIRIKRTEIWVFYTEVDEPLKLDKKQVTEEQSVIIQTFLKQNDK